jgi:ubiquinol-cytochrome c reductase cytochrome b subunit
MKLLSNLMSWVDARFPATETYEYHMSKYYAPKNFNFWYFFGVLSMVVLVNQLVTGFWLTMIYTPTGDGAFDSIEYIMRDVDYGWLLRYMHSTGHLLFLLLFICICSVVCSTALIKSRVNWCG